MGAMPNFGGGPKPSTQQVKSEVREGLVEHAESDKLVDQHIPPEPVYEEPQGDTPDRITGNAKLSKLVDEDFPFDESQLAAIAGLSEADYGCLTGAAGTGKTTVTKGLVDKLLSSTRIGTVDMRQYWSRDMDKRVDNYVNPYEMDDDYEYDESNAIIPTIAMCAFTGRASQMIKKNFPREWHGNIMTIHRMLGFVPESYEEWDDNWEDPETGEKGGYRKKIRFVPTYNAAVQLPWDIILIDEAGMLGLDLWHQLLDAIKPGCRIYMIGDINQLQPVHGKSVFGFAMARWPTYELSKVHRQQGQNNPIVDNAWRVIHGLRPEPEGKFQMIELPGDAPLASRKVRAIIRKLKDMNIYDPIRDSVITPINGDKGGAGYMLGQMPLNRAFALMFNPESENERYLIDGGREKKQFAVGDKVMATRNDWEAGITNGMTGVITSIKEHEGYAGDRDRFGPIVEVNKRFAGEDAELTDGFIDLEALENTLIAVDEGKKASKEKRERGPASHIVTVQFGHGEHGFEIPFETLAEVGSLQTAYVTTCHKMQGGESPVVIVILHESHRRMHTREWLYTAITRASEKCIILFTDMALRVSLNKQAIKGATLREKIVSFNELMGTDPENDRGIVQLPVSESKALTILDREDKVDHTTAVRLTTQEERSGGLAQLIKQQKARADEQEQPMAPEAESTGPRQEVHVHVSKIVVKNIFAPPPQVEPETPSPEVVDGGTLSADSVDSHRAIEPPNRSLPAPPRLVSTVGAARAILWMREAVSGPKMLTHQPIDKAGETVTLIDGPLDEAARVEKQAESRKEAQLGVLFGAKPKPVEAPKKNLASLFAKKG